MGLRKFHGGGGGGGGGVTSIQPTASGNERQLPRIFSHSATDGQVTWLRKKCHKTWTILWIIADTVEGRNIE